MSGVLYRNVKALRRQFGEEFDLLPQEQQVALVREFERILLEEYDTPDDTMSREVIDQNTEDAAQAFCRSIAKGLLAEYMTPNAHHPYACYCDNGHEQNETVCMYCWNKGGS